MDELRKILQALLSLGIVPAFGFGVASLARRRPRWAAALIGLVIAAGSWANARAVGEGYGFDPASRFVTFRSAAARRYFAVAQTLLTLGIPALPLIVFARAPNGKGLGPRGLQWFPLLFAHFMVSVVVSAIIDSWLTGHIK